MKPERLIEIINGYFTIAARAISELEGLIDKFMGDAVMALFNTPLNPQEDHYNRVVQAAQLMREGVQLYHETIPEEERLFFGIGIHVGEAVIGNVGSQLRKDYSAIGDAVNLAKRLQEIAHANQIILSQEAYDHVKDWVEVEKLEPVQVKGRQALTQVYDLK